MSSTDCVIDFFEGCRFPIILKPAIGGLLLGMLGDLAASSDVRRLWLDPAWPLTDTRHDGSLLLVLCFGKILATSLTISSGGSGGVFAPSLFIGAMLGGAFGQFCNHVIPGAIEHPEALVLVGMGGFFAGVARVPLTAMLMVCEMSGSYALLVPLMLVSIVNTAILSSRWTLYEEQVPSMVDSPAHQGDFVIDVLEQIHVGEVFDAHRHLDLVTEDTPLPEILKLAAALAKRLLPGGRSRQSDDRNLLAARSCVRF